MIIEQITSSMNTKKIDMNLSFIRLEKVQKTVPLQGTVTSDRKYREVGKRYFRYCETYLSIISGFLYCLYHCSCKAVSFSHKAPTLQSFTHVLSYNEHGHEGVRHRKSPTKSKTDWDTAQAKTNLYLPTLFGHTLDTKGLPPTWKCKVQLLTVTECSRQRQTKTQKMLSTTYRTTMRDSTGRAEWCKQRWKQKMISNESFVSVRVR